MVAGTLVMVADGVAFSIMVVVEGGFVTAELAIGELLIDVKILGTTTGIELKRKPSFVYLQEMQSISYLFMALSLELRKRRDQL